MKKLFKFLATFADFAFSHAANTFNVVPKFNDLDNFTAEVTVGGTPGAASDTYTLTLPPDLKDFVPMSVQAYTEANPSVRLTTLAITSHNQSTGVTVLTASGVVNAGAKVSVFYVRAS